MNTKLKTALLFTLCCALVTGLQPVLLAQGGGLVSGGANGASVNAAGTVLGVPASVSIPSLAPVSLPAGGGSQTNQVANVSVQLGTSGTLNLLSTSLVVNRTSGELGPSTAHAESSSTVDNLSILNGLITATTIRSMSTSDATGAQASSSANGSFANQLRIAGVLREQSEFAPNTVVAINSTINVTLAGTPVSVPVSGTVTINEQIQSGDGVNASSLTVNFLHVVVNGSVSGLISLSANIVVATASSGAALVSAPNSPPVLNLPGPQTVQAGSTLVFHAFASDPDPGDTVTLMASNLPANAAFTPNPAVGNPAGGQLSFTPSQSQAGQTFMVGFNATDSRGSSVSGMVSITVTSSGPPSPGENRPPIISVPGPQVVEVGTTLQFTVSASDPDGDTVTLSANGLPMHASFDAGSGAFVFTPVNAQIGAIFDVAFTATDARGASSSASVEITVVAASGADTPPGPPVISVPPSPIIVKVGETLTFIVSAKAQAQGCSVSIAASGVPPNASFDSASGIFTFNPTANQEGASFTVSFVATDCFGQTADGSVTIIVVDEAVPDDDTTRGRICVAAKKVVFDNVPVNGGCGSLSISLVNRGSGLLRINGLRFSVGLNFRAEGMSAAPFVLRSAATVELKVIFEPKEIGVVTDTLTILTSDPANPEVRIKLKGKATG